MTLEQLEAMATDLRMVRDNATRELRLVVAEIDKRKASESVKEIVSGLSEEQKREMYAQLIGVNTANGGAKGENSKNIDHSVRRIK